ncbi:hypothetical protein PMAYCL1PPCAC_10522, partial [Pristionchus mayeri]
KDGEEEEDDIDDDASLSLKHSLASSAGGSKGVKRVSLLLRQNDKAIPVVKPIEKFDFTRLIAAAENSHQALISLCNAARTHQSSTAALAGLQIVQRRVDEWTRTRTRFGFSMFDLR